MIYKLYITQSFEKIIYGLLILPIFGVFFSLIFLNALQSVIYISLGFGFYAVGLYLFRRCIPYIVELREEGIRLYYKRICDYSLREQYRRNGKPVKKDYLLEINREEGWIEIRWEQIKNIWVGRGYIEPRCRIVMVNGDRVYLLNPVDRKIIDEVVKAWKLWKNEKSKNLKISGGDR